MEGEKLKVWYQISISKSQSNTCECDFVNYMEERDEMDKVM